MLSLTTYLVNGIQHIHAERTFVVIFLLLRPFLGLRVEEILSPKPEISNAATSMPCQTHTTNAKATGGLNKVAQKKPHFSQ
jgi:hypothetical protein